MVIVWPMHPYTTDMYEGMLAETVMIQGYNGDTINAYFARPLGPGPFPGVVLIPHMPGWDEWYRETTRRFAHHGYLALSPNIYYRFGHGSPDDVAAKARGSGGVADDSAVGDAEGSLRFLKSLPLSNKKVGVFGTCSSGRQAFLSACRLKGFESAEISGSGKGPRGWFKLEQVNVSYDHPTDAQLDHALNIDFVNQKEGPNARVAVELSPESARKLVKAILTTLSQAGQTAGNS